MKYSNFRYIYPPRPEYKITPNELKNYEDDFLSQPKFNGSCCELYINDGDYRVFGRHRNEDLNLFSLDKETVVSLNTDDGWLVLVGEYMNKNKKGLDGKPWNHKFVIFDILVKDGEYLVGTTFEERISILDEMYGTEDYNEYMYKVDNHSDVYRVKTLYSDFKEIWDEIVKIDMLECLVLKKKDAKLQRGTVQKNNMNSQLKCRKETKNYLF